MQQLNYAAEDAARIARAQLSAANRQRATAIAEAKKVAAALAEARYSQQEIAQRLGVARLTVRRWLGVD